MRKLKYLLFIIPLFFIPFFLSKEVRAEVTTGWVYIQPKSNIATRIGFDTTGKLKLLLATGSSGKSSGQKFLLTKLSDGTYRINTGSGGGFKVLTNDLSQVAWNKTSSQKFNIIENFDSTVQIVNSNKALTYPNKTIGTKLTMSAKSTEDNQKFIIKPFAEKYTVTFVEGNNTILKRESVKKGLSATAPANPTRKGYTFAGWDKSFTNITSNITINPKWTAKTVKIIFHKNIPNDTSTYTDTYTYDVSNQTFGMRLANKTGQFGTWNRAGYTLLGWSREQDATTKTHDVYSKITDNWINNNSGTVDLYAVWQRNDNILLHFDPNGANNASFWQMGDLELNENKNLKLNSRWSKKNYIQTGYFLGNTKYIMHDSYTYGASDFPSKEETLKVLWEPSMARIVYDGNGGTKDSGDTTYYDKEKHVVKSNMFKKEGHTFSGWNTKKDGTGVAYKVGSSLTNFNAEIIESTVDSNGIVQEKSKIFYPDWEKTDLDQEKMYVQGGDYFKRNGKEYILGTWVGINAEYDHHLVCVFDYNTGAVLAQATEKELGKHIGHCNGVAYSPETDSFFIGLHNDKCPQMYKDFPNQNLYSELHKKTENHLVNLVELKWDGDKTITINKAYVLRKDWGTTNILGNIAAIDYYNGVYHVRHGSFIYEYVYDENKKEFVHLNRYKDKNGVNLKVEGGGGFGGKEAIYNPLTYTNQNVCGQGWAYNGFAYATGLFYGNSYNSFVSYIFPLTRTNSNYTTSYTSPVSEEDKAKIIGLNVVSPIKFNTGDLDKARKQNKSKEIQDFSYDDEGNLYILCCRWGKDKDGDKQTDGKTIKNEYALSVLKCNGSGMPTTRLYAQWK